MTNEPKTREIDGVLYVEDGHPTAGERVVPPFLFDGHECSAPSDTLVPDPAALGIDLTRFTKLRRLDP